MNIAAILNGNALEAPWICGKTGKGMSRLMGGETAMTSAIYDSALEFESAES